MILNLQTPDELINALRNLARLDAIASAKGVTHYQRIDAWHAKEKLLRPFRPRPKRRKDIDDISDRVTHNKHYKIPGHPDCYLLVRHSVHSTDFTEQRVCLYRKGVINKHLFGSLAPGDQLLCNELRNGRSLKRLYLDMAFKCD